MKCKLSQAAGLHLTQPAQRLKAILTHSQAQKEAESSELGARAGRAERGGRKGGAVVLEWERAGAHLSVGWRSSLQPCKSLGGLTAALAAAAAAAAAAVIAAAAWLHGCGWCEDAHSEQYKCQDAQGEQSPLHSSTPLGPAALKVPPPYALAS
eukprot:673107-Pelagomonas_calceolata.AAC.8